jgi:hypothetical protein
MPLKKQKSVPEIPKSREKKISVIRESIPEKKDSGIEFICEIYFSTDISAKKQYYCFGLITVLQFSNLNYELSVNTVKKKNSIDITILGLKTNPGYINKTGPAGKEVFFENLYGKYTINIIKQDGSINSAVLDFNIFKKSIKLIDVFLPEKRNNRKFIKFEVAQNKFKYSNEGKL